MNLHWKTRCYSNNESLPKLAGLPAFFCTGTDCSPFEKELLRPAGGPRSLAMGGRTP